MSKYLRRCNEVPTPKSRSEDYAPPRNFSPCKILTVFIFWTPYFLLQDRVFFFKRSLKTFPVFLSVGRGSVIYFKPRSAFSLYSYSTFPRAVSGTPLSKHSPQCHSQRESDNHNSPEDSMCCFQVYHQPAEAKN